MIFKNSSKSKLTLAFISIVITFFVWQQGLRDSLNRPSVSFDISQKEQEIAELSVQSIPVNLKSFFIINDPVDQINKSLTDVSFEELTERNKLIRIITSESSDPIIYKSRSKNFENKNFKFLLNEIDGLFRLSLKPCCQTKKVMTIEIKAKVSFDLEIFLKIIIYHVVGNYS